MNSSNGGHWRVGRQLRNATRMRQFFYPRLPDIGQSPVTPTDGYPNACPKNFSHSRVRRPISPSRRDHLLAGTNPLDVMLMKSSTLATCLAVTG